MGWEGSSSKLYFKILAELIPAEYGFEGRSSRPARDAFNAFLNYGYGILYSQVERALIIAGLDPYIGLLHTDNYNKKSFVFDFIEPYRHFIDEPVFYLFSRRKFETDYLDNVHKGVVLSTQGKKFFAPLLLEHLDSIVRYHNKNRKLIECVQTDAHAFANYLIGKRTGYVDSSLQTKLDNFLLRRDIDPDQWEEG
jgi:CRISPR-associated protein Cas1